MANRQRQQHWLGRKKGYLEHFLRLRCAGDVLNAVGPLQGGSREIAEAVCILQLIRSHAKEGVFVVELCAGNALPSVLVSHMTPVAAWAYNKRQPAGTEYSKVRKFAYAMCDPSIGASNPTILVARRAHGDCVEAALDFWSKPNVVQMVLIPTIPNRARSIAESCGGKIIQDRKLSGPCNLIVMAQKEYKVPVVLEDIVHARA